MESVTSRGILEDLIETLEDGAKGFERAADLLQEDEEGRTLAPTMRSFSEQRQRFSAELREIAGRSGETIAESGSAGGALHRAWMGLKDAATNTDIAAILGAAETGEDHAVSEYDDALERDDLASELHEVVARQAQAIRKAHEDVKALRDRFAE